MGEPVVHFEVVGKDAGKLRDFFGQMFGWKWSDAMGPTDYATVSNADGIGGGVGDAPEGYPGHVTFYVQVPDVEAGQDVVVVPDLEPVERREHLVGGDRPDVGPEHGAVRLGRGDHQHTAHAVHPVEQRGGVRQARGCAEHAQLEHAPILRERAGSYG